MGKINESMGAAEARVNLREHIKRLARVRRDGAVTPRHLVWPERQLLFSLVHVLVCGSKEYDPLLDGQLAWAAWFLRWCEAPRDAGAYEHEDAQLMLILGEELVRCGKDSAAGDDDHDSGDDLTYSIG